MPLRVLLISPKAPPYGGIGNWTNLLLAWSSTNRNLLIDHIDTAVHWREVTDHAIYKRIVGGLLQATIDIARIFVHCVINKPQVLHLTTSGGLGTGRDIIILLLSRLLHLPSVCHIRFGRIPQLADAKNIEWRLIFTAMRIASKVIAIDRETELALKPMLSKTKLNFLPNAIGMTDYSLDSCQMQRTKRVLYLGHVIPTKGISELIDAWVIIDNSAWELMIAGPCEQSYVKELLAKVDMHRTPVHFVGQKSHDEAMALMMTAEIFVLPSYTEGFPNVILEAMSLGKPIIATNVGAIPDMLQYSKNESCGVIIEPKNAQSLVSALRQLISTPDLRFALGKKAREKVEKDYEVNKIFNRLFEIWLVSGSGKSGQ